MAESIYSGGSAGPYSFTFDSYQSSDVKVSVDGVIKATPNHYTISNYTTTGGGQVTFTAGNIPTSTQNIRIFRITGTSAIKATFAAGSSIKSEDLNNNFRQMRLAAADAIDESTRILSVIDETTPGQLTLELGAVGQGTITTDKLANSAVNTVKIADDAVTAAKIANDAVTTTNITQHAVTQSEIAPDSISTAKIQDNAVTEAKVSGNNGFVPTGAVFHFVASSVPAGYLKCNGDTIPNGSGTVQGVTANFAALYALVGATLPDLRGEFIRGFDDGRGVDSGRSINTTQSDQNKQHNHTLTGGSATGTFLTSSSLDDRTTQVDSEPNQSTVLTPSTHIDTTSASVSYTQPTVNNDGGSEARPRNVALLACIKY